MTWVGGTCQYEDTMNPKTSCVWEHSGVPVDREMFQDIWLGLPYDNAGGISQLTISGHASSSASSDGNLVDDIASEHRMAMCEQN